ncbi:hypothetical protein CFOL_v3_20846 [Cephalotus follicularis]|uniref:Exo_endo_phos domain-containing protein n=1 Tax=Cephalotus follicularis TaxID=3775 RepID=A0A1Q3CAX2_CEPFO|nr:hypothetical protein CFOL_v3_20846 [Cephalotus follicularis]
MLETRVRSSNKERISRRLFRGWKSVTNHSQFLLGRIWILWNPSSVQFTVISVSNQVIHVRLVIEDTDVYVSIIYGSYDYKEKRDLWSNHIHHSIKFSDKPWAIHGDFNVSRFPFGHSGVRLVLCKMMKEFKVCISKCDEPIISTLNVSDARDIITFLSTI